MDVPYHISIIAILSAFKFQVSHRNFYILLHIVSQRHVITPNIITSLLLRNLSPSHTPCWIFQLNWMFKAKRANRVFFIFQPIQIQNYPTFKELEQNETSHKSCHYKSVRLPSVTKAAASYSNTYLCQLVMFVYTFIVTVR